MHLFFDTETEGLPFDHNLPDDWTWNWPRVVQVAWLAAGEDGTEVECFESIVKPEGFVIPEEASRIHGITTERALREGAPLGEVLERTARKMRLVDTLVAHNARFDRAVLGAEYLRAGLANPFVGKRVRCTMRESTIYCGLAGSWGGPKWPTLQELHLKLFGETFDGAHDALTDVRACARCYFELKRRQVMI